MDFKHMINFPDYVTCFLKLITDQIRGLGFDRMEEETMTIPIVSSKYKYCFEAVDLIEKSVKRLGYLCNMISYSVVTDSDKNGNLLKKYKYVYKITKKPKK